MAIKGKVRETTERKEFVKDLYVGFANVRVAGINPTRAQMNKMFGKTDDGSDEKEEFKYLDEDKDGNTRFRLAFWLNDEENDKYFVQSINLIDAPRISNDGKKVQLINSTCDTTWVPFKVDDEGNVLDEPNEKLIPNWFLEFTNKEKEVLGKKKWRVSLRGEEELAKFLRVWVNMDWWDPGTEVMVDTKKLFQENTKELKEIVDSMQLSKNFVILTGVRTNKDDNTKKYQEIFKKAYLPSGMMQYIKDGNHFPNDWSRKQWREFTKEVEGQYGFTCHHKLVPLEKYNEKGDPVATNAGKPETEDENEY